VISRLLAIVVRFVQQPCHLLDFDELRKESPERDGQRPAMASDF